MIQISKIVIILSMFILAACSGASQEATAVPTLTPFPTIVAQATRTAISNPTALFSNQAAPTAIPQATAFIPATFTPAVVTDSNGILLTNGHGITNGAVVSDGEFQVEGYCNILNPSYGVAEDGTDWFCTFNGQRALTLRQQQFNDICQRTYNNNMSAIAIKVNNGQSPAYQWRCYELVILPTATSSAPPQLLMNGQGMSTGAIMNNGQVEVEGYCSAINVSYGVEVDENFWYCTENGNRILTLGVAEFDDLCIRTYSNPAAYSEQIQNNDRPAYRWRCFAIPR